MEGGVILRATHRVINSSNETAGFIVDERYVKYFNVKRNIELISNLRIDDDGNICVDKELKEVTVQSINKEIYQKECQKNPLVRDVQEELEEWRAKWSKYVLCLSGARQTGKTTELMKFAYKNYEQIIYLNLAEEESLKLFVELVIRNDHRFGLMKYCRKMGLEEYADTTDTILIVDEIQESSEIYNSIRSLQSNLNCHIVITGSYLGKILHPNYFKPAGNLYDIEMLPLSFREFCKAFKKEDELLVIDLFGRDEAEKYIELTELYKIYRKIGGYPAVVQSYITDRDFEVCYKVIQGIIDKFTDESASYFENDKSLAVFRNVYKAAFLCIAKEKKGTSSKDIGDITDFVKIDTKEHVSRAEVNKAVSWLKYSKILGGCDLYNQGNVLDLLNERRFYFMDCGIANYISTLTSAPNDMVEGVLSETFVYTELYRIYKTNLVKGDVPCCSVYGNYELDFMIVDKNDVKYGIEVKTSNANVIKSLNKYFSKGFIDEAYLVGITKGGIRENGVKAIPIYTVGCRFPYNSCAI